MKQEIDRRGFFIGAGLTATGSLLTACNFQGAERPITPESQTPQGILRHIFYDEPFPIDSLDSTTKHIAAMVNQFMLSDSEYTIELLDQPVYYLPHPSETGDFEDKPAGDYALPPVTLSEEEKKIVATPHLGLSYDGSPQREYELLVDMIAHSLRTYQPNRKATQFTRGTELLSAMEIVETALADGYGVAPHTNNVDDKDIPVFDPFNNSKAYPYAEATVNLTRTSLKRLGLSASYLLVESNLNHPDFPNNVLERQYKHVYQDSRGFEEDPAKAEEVVSELLSLFEEISPWSMKDLKKTTQETSARLDTILDPLDSKVMLLVPIPIHPIHA